MSKEPSSQPGGGVNQPEGGAGRQPGVVGRTPWDLLHDHWKAVSIGALAAVAIAAILLALGAFVLGLHFTVDKEGFKLSFGSPPSPQLIPRPVFQKWWGYYGDLDDKQQTFIGVEELSLSFDQETSTFRGKSSGKWVEPNGEVINREWTSGGFFRDDLLSGSFMSHSSKSISLGAHYLRAIRDDEYVGTVVFHEWYTKAPVMCPYVLSRRELTVEKAKARWPSVLGGTCIPLKLL